jgi:hypothetical protein
MKSNKEIKNLSEVFDFTALTPQQSNFLMDLVKKIKELEKEIEKLTNTIDERIIKTKSEKNKEFIKELGTLLKDISSDKSSKELENLLRPFIEKAYNEGRKSQLNNQTEKIKELIEEGNKWLKFEHGITCGDKTEVWVVKSKKDNLAIGSVRWYGKWRHYCFFPQSETVFSDRCLLAISDFVEKMNNAHKTRKELQSLKKSLLESGIGIEPTETMPKQDRETLSRMKKKELPVETDSHESSSLPENSKGEKV